MASGLWAMQQLAFFTFLTSENIDNTECCINCAAQTARQLAKQLTHTCSTHYAIQTAT